MAAPGVATPPRLPLSPSNSPTIPNHPTPAFNPMDTQYTIGIQEMCGLSRQRLEDWEARYNRHTIPIMHSSEFQEVVAKVVSGREHVGVKAVEEEVARLIKEERNGVESKAQEACLEFIYNTSVPSKDVMIAVGTDSLVGHLEFMIRALERLTELLVTKKVDMTKGEVRSATQPPAKKARRPAGKPRNTTKQSVKKDDVLRVRRSGRIEKKKASRRPS